MLCKDCGVDMEVIDVTTNTVSDDKGYKWESGWITWECFSCGVKCVETGDEYYDESGEAHYRIAAIDWIPITPSQGDSSLRQ